MTDFEEMYKKFNMDANQAKHLNKLASRHYPFDEADYSISIETVVINDAKETRIEKGIVHAKLV